jgi:hypothetical protein
LIKSSRRRVFDDTLVEVKGQPLRREWTLLKGASSQRRQ